MHYWSFPMLKLIKNCTAVVLFMALMVLTAHAAECSHRIIFLPQSHPTRSDDLRHYTSDVDEVARSQFSVAKYIEQHRNVPVFAEQAIARDYTWSDVDLKQLPSLNKMFPHGLPEKFENLSIKQKTALVGYEAVFFELELGNMPIIHKVLENEEVRSQIYFPIQKWEDEHQRSKELRPSEIVNLIFEKRERLALEQIFDYWKANPGQKDALLIFGSAHRFDIYPDLISPNCIVIPSQFQKSWRPDEHPVGPSEHSGDASVRIDTEAGR